MRATGPEIMDLQIAEGWAFEWGYFSYKESPKARARLMRAYPVSARINHVANDDEECLRPVEFDEAQDGLFC